jgi:putative ABC transport system substrate-binding protein
MNRRDVVIAPLAVCASMRARTQVPGRLYRVGYLGFTATNSTNDLRNWNGFVQRLRELGYDQGRNLVIEDRYAEGRLERYPEFAAEMVKIKADIVFTSNPGAARAVMAVSPLMPIVTIYAPDPVRSGLAASLARPGGQLTGITNFGPELVLKQLELLKAALPSVTRIAHAWCPRCVQDSGYSAAEIAAILAERSAAAQSLGITLLPLDVNAASDFDATSAALLRQRAEALLIGSTPINVALREKWHTFADRNRLPTMEEVRGNGSMFSYGADPAPMYVRAAELVAKILGGAAPGELPMERPTRFTFAIDLRLAKAMGITIPQSLLLRADEVIQ